MQMQLALLVQPECRGGAGTPNRAGSPTLERTIGRIDVASRSHAFLLTKVM